MIDLVHTSLVVAFLAVTSGLLALMAVQRLRIQGVRMVWRTSTPAVALPILFVGIIGILAVLAHNTVTGVSPWVFAGYMAGGFLWFLAVLLGSTVVVSRYGVVRGFGRRESALAWIQVSDYFEAPGRRGVQFVFLYRGADGAPRRLEVPVPSTQVDQFRSLINERLDHRQSNKTVPAEGRRAIS